jgi:ATP-binding cassette subfamily F protein 3
MIQANNLYKGFGDQTLFQKASFQINSGERVGLVGRNGQGKSTLFRMILGQEDKDDGVIAWPKNYTLGHLEQHLHFTENTVLAEACKSLKIHEDGYLEDYKAKSILGGLGFSDADFTKAPSEFSGGYQLRIQLTKVLLEEPDCLLLDEPTNYLDILSIKWLEIFLKQWPGELLLITHDRAFMRKICTHTMGIYQENLRKFACSPDKFYEILLEEEDLNSRTAENQAKRKAELEQFVTRFKAKASKAKAAQSKQKLLDKMEDIKVASKTADLDFVFTEASFPGKKMLEVENLHFHYQPEKELLGGVSFDVFKGDRVAVIGPNGKGKTTLLNLLAEEMVPKQGRVHRSDNMRVGYFGQTNVNRLHDSATVEEEIGANLDNYSISRARGLAGLMLFQGDNALKKVSVLSGGEKARVLLGQILGQQTNLLLLDEPTNHLDMESIQSLTEAIEGFGGSVIIVTHSEELLKKIANKLIVFDQDETFVFEGTYDEFMKKRGWGNQPAKNNKNNKNNKKERKLRANRLNERNKRLKPLKIKQEQLEVKIDKLERQEKEINQTLIAASNANDGEAISSLGIQLGETQTKQETFWTELETIEEEISNITSEYNDLD